MVCSDDGKDFLFGPHCVEFLIYVEAGLNYPLHYILNVKKVEGELFSAMENNKSSIC